MLAMESLAWAGAAERDLAARVRQVGGGAAGPPESCCRFVVVKATSDIPEGLALSDARLVAEKP